MDYYAADENYFTEEGLEKGHEALVRKLDAKKRQHTEEAKQRRAQRRAARRAEQRRQSRHRRWALIITAVTLVGLVGGWALSQYVL